MGMPNIPNIKAEFDLDFKESLKLLMTSIALEEISLSHILNAEGEKIQKFLSFDDISKHDILKLNDSVNVFLGNLSDKNQVLFDKLSTVKDLIHYVEKYYKCKKI